MVKRVKSPQEERSQLTRQPDESEVWLGNNVVRVTVRSMHVHTLSYGFRNSGTGRSGRLKAAHVRMYPEQDLIDDDG
jgi:hypothetical protein